MKRLRHPVRAIREPFGTAGLIVACVALVLALTGAAFAAGGLTGKQKKEVEKIAKKYAGKPGAPGTPGAQGPAGANGKDGAAGAAGAKGATGPQGVAGPKGATGAKGTNGTNGTSVDQVAEFAVGDEEGCEEKGGIAYELHGNPNSYTEICNGKEGKDGKEGSPWTAGGTLPPGATETGSWSVSGTGRVGTALSFPVPITEPIEEGSIHFVLHNGQAPGPCPGRVSNPEAAPGVFCVYYFDEGGSEPFVNTADFLPPEPFTQRVGRAGALLYWTLSEPEPGVPGAATGTFAVTGCAEESGVQFSCPGF